MSAGGRGQGVYIGEWRRGMRHGNGTPPFSLSSLSSSLFFSLIPSASLCRAHARRAMLTRAAPPAGMMILHFKALRPGDKSAGRRVPPPTATALEVAEFRPSTKLRARESAFYDGEWEMDAPHGQVCGRRRRRAAPACAGAASCLCDLTSTRLSVSVLVCLCGGCQLLYTHSLWQGEMVDPLGGYYKGEWAHGKRSGKGLSDDRRGNVYKGFFKNGVKHRHGKETLADGTVYSGDYRDGRRDGQVKCLPFSKLHGAAVPPAFPPMGLLPCLLFIRQQKVSGPLSIAAAPAGHADPRRRDVRGPVPARPVPRPPSPPPSPVAPTHVPTVHSLC